MNTISKGTLARALLASFAIAALPGYAADSRDDKITVAAADDNTLVELCSTSTNGKVPKAGVVKALHRMLDMGETPEAAKMSKDKRRDMQFQVFWREVAKESYGG